MPITPCRVADTRLGGGIVMGSSTRSFYVAGTFGFAPQGGKSGGCGVPLGATAVATNVTTTQSATSGYLTGYANGGAAPLSSFLSYTRTANVTGNPVLPLATGSGKQLNIKASATTHIVIDVTGYYNTQSHLIILADGTVWYGSQPPI